MSRKLDGNIKIWRYMDLSGFISLVINEALYFPCATEFQDPFEGHLPASHKKAVISISEKTFGSFIQNPYSRGHGVAPVDYEKLHAQATEEVKRKNGVSCWHMNDHESEAMWKLYADKGIAIESTIGQFQNSLPDDVHGSKINFYEIRYEDFENAEIEKGHAHYILAIKRKSFEHERELRASVSLPVDGQGIYVKCNLEMLINKVHISPLARKQTRDDLEKLCDNLTRPLRKQISRSSLYERP